jgi:hypothetical protein
VNVSSITDLSACEHAFLHQFTGFIVPRRAAQVVALKTAAPPVTCITVM